MRASMHWPLSDAFVPLRPSPADADGAFMAKLIPAVQAVTLYGPTNMAEVISRVNSIMRCAALPAQGIKP